MNFFRNPEIKKSFAVYLVLSVIATVIGFYFSAGCGILTGLVCFIFSAVHFVFAVRRYKNISDITNKLDDILYGGESFDIAENCEGELSILKNELQKLIIMLHSQSDELQKEKLYLSDSIANISHQLRTPLTGINLILNLLSEPQIDRERRQELVAQLSQMLRRMDSLVTTLLKIAQIDAGKVIFEEKSVSISDLIEKATEPLLVLFDIRGQKLKTNITNGIVTADMVWTAEAIGNILKNCSEHTPNSGVITVTAKDTPIFALIEICDTGSGFTDEELPHIFERFYKGNSDKGENYGIGMSLSKMIIEKQNGIIKAENRSGGGARFEIRLYHKN